MNLHYNLQFISIHGELEIMLEFECSGLDERNNSSEGSYNPSKDAQVIQVRGAAAP